MALHIIFINIENGPSKKENAAIAGIVVGLAGIIIVPTVAFFYTLGIGHDHPLGPLKHTHRNMPFKKEPRLYSLFPNPNYNVFTVILSEKLF